MNVVNMGSLLAMMQTLLFSRVYTVGQWYEDHKCGKAFVSIFFFLRWSFVLVTQAGVQWHSLGSLQPSPPSFKQFSCLTRRNSWDYKHIPPRQLIFFVFSRDGVSPFWPGWFPTPGLKWSTRLGLPKCWDYRCEAPCLAWSIFSCFLAAYMSYFEKNVFMSLPI